MHKSGVSTFGFLLCSLIMLAAMPVLNQHNSNSNTAMAQEYGLMMDDNYKSKYSSFEKEVIECNNFNLNVNDNDDGGDVAANTGNNANNDDENNKNDDIVGQLLEPKQGEEETEINRHSSSISEYDSKDSQSTAICKYFNNNVPSTDTETLTVIKKTACQADTQTCQQIQIQPSNFTVVIEGNDPSQNNFPGSSTGTNVELEAGPYNVTEQGLDPVIPEICNAMGFEGGRVASDLGENLFICTNISADCEGNITIGNPQTCTIGNVLVLQQVIGNNVYVVWEDNTNEGSIDIFFTVSNDNGQTFSTPENISNTPLTSFNPKISTDGNNVYVVWEETQENTFVSDIFFSISNDNGQTFSTPINLSDNIGNSLRAQILTEGNNVYVVWMDNTPDTTLGEFEIFFSISNDNGQTFSSPENISNNEGSQRLSQDPQISIEGNNVYVVYYTWDDNTPGNYDIFFSVSNDNGQTFSSPENISNNEGDSVEPQIVSEGNNVYIAWIANTNGNNDIFFSISNDNGQTFSSPENLSNNDGVSEHPHITTEGNTIYLIWEDCTPENCDIFFTVSNDNGQTFSSPENLSNSVGFSAHPQILTVGNNVYVAWEDNTPGNYDIFFSVSNDNGQTFSSPENISNNTGFSINPQISQEGNNIYIVWEDDTLDNDEIFFSISNDNGQTFSSPENLSNSEERDPDERGSNNPQITSSTS